MSFKSVFPIVALAITGTAGITTVFNGAMMNGSAYKNLCTYTNQDSNVAYIKGQLMADKFENLKVAIDSSEPRIARPVRWRDVADALKNNDIMKKSSQTVADSVLKAMNLVKAK